MQMVVNNRKVGITLVSPGNWAQEMFLQGNKL